MILYGAKGGSSTTSDLYTIDPATGVATSVGPIGFAITGLAFDPTTGILYGATSKNSAASPKCIITIDPATGAGTLVGPQALAGPNDTCTDICFDSAGQMYGETSTSHSFATVDKATGAATLLGTDDVPNTPATVSCNSADVVYRPPFGAGQDLVMVDRATGARTFVAALGAGPGANGPNAAAFDEADILYALWNINPGVHLVTINTATGAVTDIGSTTALMDGLAWSVPAPITADFVGAPLSGSVPFTVLFTDLSTGPVTAWAWDFGDGATSTDQNPAHTYTREGDFDVSLTAT